MEVGVLGNVMTVKTGVMKSGKALVDGNECTLKLTPELLMYESQTKQGSVFLRSIKAVGVVSDELVLDYEKARFELARIRIKPTSDITLFQKKVEFDEASMKYTVRGEDKPDFVSGRTDSWLIEWYATLGCGRGGVSGFDLWDEEADAASQRGERTSGSLWVSPIAFLYDQVSISDSDYLSQRIYENWKTLVESAAKNTSFDNQINPDQIINFAESPDFYRDLNLAAILEKKHFLGIDGWNQIDMINIGNQPVLVQRDWAKLKYIRFMLGWINFLSGHAYTSEYGLWPEEYEQFFITTEVILQPFIRVEEKERARKYSNSVEMASAWKRKYDADALKSFKNWFLKVGNR
jgi:hypothetical protein